MRNGNKNFLRAFVMMMALAACGRGGSPVTTATNGVNGVQSANLSSGGITFSGNNIALTATTLMAGAFPTSTGLGTYGQVVIGQASGGNQIQYPEKTGTNGKLQLTASSLNGMNTVSGAIQLNPTYIQQIQAAYGNAQVASAAIWVVQNVTMTNSTSSAPLYTGIIYQAIVYLYLQSGQMIGPIVF